MSAAAATVLPSKKRKASHDSAVSAQRPIRKESEASSKQSGNSGQSEDTTQMAFRAILDGASLTSSKSLMPHKKRKHSTDFSEGPLRKRKLSAEPSLSYRPRFQSLGSIDDAALGLVPLGSQTGSLASDEQKLIPLPPLDVKASQEPSALAALDHLEALGDDASMASGSKTSGNKVSALMPKHSGDDSSSSKDTMASGNQRLLVEALLMGDKKRRDRFESWGGMSDVSFNMGSAHLGDHPLMDGAVSAVLATTARNPSGHAEEASATSSVSGDADKPVPSKISLTRDRLLSIASLGDASVGTGGSDISPNLQAVVAAAMATVGDQLAELAGVVESVAGNHSVSSDMLRDMIKDDHSSVISTASSLPEIQAQLQAQLDGRPRSWSTSSNPISVDYDAVMAAVDAANAATGTLDYAHIASMGPPSVKPDESSSSLLPPIPPIPPLPKSDKSERDMEAIRARARAAAGYIPPANLKPGEVPPPQPVKKRPKSATPHKASYSKGKNQLYSPEPAYSMYHAANKASSQKWDEMYECLVEFVEERRGLENKGMSEKERKDWEWDGNVPTTYKTRDGKALGRWINNQRSAKHKGSLKKDREVKLMSTGLKWSVLSTNSWQDMMDELKIYVIDRTKEGQDWDGNVPTNYKIKGSADEDGEEKNLGRWINRQRSLYQSGKLRKDREADLEKIGLKWSVLSTTSWQSMYETLLDYVKDRKGIDGSWDGNVPANFKTTDQPPKALGRWINRQRTAHQKNKLKAEFVEKLNAVGLKWSVHERRPPSASNMQTPLRHNLTASRPTPSSVYSCSTAATPYSVASSAAVKPNSLRAISTPMVKVKAEPNATPAAKATTKPLATSALNTPTVKGKAEPNATAAATTKPAAIATVTTPVAKGKAEPSVTPVAAAAKEAPKPAAAVAAVKPPAAAVSATTKTLPATLSNGSSKPAGTVAATNPVAATETTKPSSVETAKTNGATQPESTPASALDAAVVEVAKPAVATMNGTATRTTPASEEKTTLASDKSIPAVTAQNGTTATTTPDAPTAAASRPSMPCSNSSEMTKTETHAPVAVKQEAD